MINSFDKIYDKGIWTGKSSGCGSNYSYINRKLINKINDIISQNDIINVCDFGCGDFNIMRHLNFTNINYTGIDVVQSIIDKNKQYENKNIKFIKNEVIPKNYDLIIVKDVLQHYEDEEVINLLTTLIENNKFVFCINGYKFIRDMTKNNWENRNINNVYRYHPLHSIKQPLLQFKEYENEKYTYRTKEYIIYKK